MQSQPLRLNRDHPCAEDLAGAFFFNEQGGALINNAATPNEPGLADNIGDNHIWSYIDRGPYGEEAVALRRRSNSEGGGGGAGIGLGRLGDESRMSLTQRGGDQWCLIYGGNITYTTFNAIFCRGDGNSSVPFAAGGMIWMCTNPTGNSRVAVDGFERFSNNGFFTYGEYHTYAVNAGPGIGLHWIRDGRLWRDTGSIPAIPSGQTRGVGICGRDVSEGTSQTNTGWHDFFLAFDSMQALEDIAALCEDPWQLVEPDIPVYAVPVALLSGPAAYFIEGDIDGQAVPEALFDYARNAAVAGDVVGLAEPAAGLVHQRNARLAGDVAGEGLVEGLVAWQRNARIAGDVVAEASVEALFATTRYSRLAGDVVGLAAVEAVLDYTRNARIEGAVGAEGAPAAGLVYQRNARIEGAVDGQAVPEAVLVATMGGRIAGDVVGQAVPAAGLVYQRNARIEGEVSAEGLVEGLVAWQRNARIAGDVAGAASVEALTRYRRNARIAGDVVGLAAVEAVLARTLARAFVGNVIGQAEPAADMVYQAFIYPPAPPFAEGLVAVPGVGRGVTVEGNGRGDPPPPSNGSA